MDRALPAGAGGGVRVSDVEVGEQTNYADGGGGAGGGAGAAGRLRAWAFRGGAGRRLLEHLQTLLEVMPTAGERPLLALPLLGEGAAAGAAGVETDGSGLPAGRCASTKLFEAQVVRSPEAVAVVFEEQRWTYAKLNARANRLAPSAEAGGSARRPGSASACLGPSR